MSLYNEASINRSLAGRQTSAHLNYNKWPLKWSTCEFNVQSDTTWITSEVVFTANHLTDTDKQNSTGKYTNWIQLRHANNTKYSKTKLSRFSCLLNIQPGNEIGLLYNAPESIQNIHMYNITRRTQDIHTAQVSE